MSWLSGILFRLYDLRVVGLARVEGSWLRSRHTWVLDFALRGFLRSGKTKPVVHWRYHRRSNSLRSIQT